MQLCPNNRNATVWEELCQLRFSNKNFRGQLDFSGNIPLANRETIENSVQFISVVNENFSNLTEKAAFDPTQNMYATGKLALSDIDTLYTLVQCTTDLSSHDCNTCLLGHSRTQTHTIYVVRQLAYSTELLVCINQA
jgi:hypothetical protein